MIKVTPIVEDEGNVGIKSMIPGGSGKRKEDHFPHAFVKLTEGDYRRVAARTSVPDEDYFIVNGVPYAIGEKGLRHGQFDRLHGAARYVPEYYGVILAISMTRSFGRSVNDVFVMGSHAPQDIDYAPDLMKAAMGKWTVENCGEKFIFDVVDVCTFDEPLGGWANVVLRKDGVGYADKTVSDGRALVLDIGGYTTDGLVIDPKGSVDYSTASSAVIGILDAVRDFEKNFRTENAAICKSVRQIEEKQIHESIRTGVMDLRGLGKVQCGDLASEVRNALTAKVMTFYARFGGASTVDTVILTGGGSALLEHELRSRLGHNKVILAGEATKLHMANVYGGGKWFLMHKAIGSFDN